MERAAWHADYERLRELLSLGISPNVIKLDDGRTPLHYLCTGDYIDFDGEDADPADFTACFELLLPGADVDAADGQGLTPLHFAVNGDRIQIIEALLEVGADLR